jgi:hypothetical protein
LLVIAEKQKNLPVIIGHWVQTQNLFFAGCVPRIPASAQKIQFLWVFTGILFFPGYELSVVMQGE